MRLLLPIILALVVVASSAHKFTAVRRKRHELDNRALSDRQTNANATTNGLNVSSIFNLIYLADIVVGDVNYSVQLDTGSSDLFIKGATYPIPNANETSLTLNLTYAIGWAYGHIAYASVQFLNHSVTSQAFVDASSANNPVLSYHGSGVLGLGFTHISTIDSLLNSAHQSTGRSLLYNLFLNNPLESNFMTFFLQRNMDPAEDGVQGSFSIGEYEPQFANISNNPRIFTWPRESPSRWNILIDAVIVNKEIILPRSSVNGAPSNKAVSLLDTGASYSYVSKEVADALYSHIPGATFDTSSGIWMLPCQAEVDMAIQIGEQLLPLHPLDVNPTMEADPSKCFGSFVPQSVLSNVDWLIGDNFLRAVYSAFNYGDFDESGIMVNPYMQFWSLVDPDQASYEFHQVRGGTPNTNITYIGLSGAALSLGSSFSDDASQTIVKFIVPMFALVALNSLILIICCIVWLVSFIRKRRVGARIRIPRSRTLRSVPVNDTSSYFAGETTPSPSIPLHAYEPVSMALSEDTFVPPSPAFHSPEGNKMRRPKSFT